MLLNKLTEYLCNYWNVTNQLSISSRIHANKKNFNNVQLFHTAAKQLLFIHLKINFVQLYNTISTARIYILYSNACFFPFECSTESKHSDRRCSKDGLEHSWQVSYAFNIVRILCIKNPIVPMCLLRNRPVPPVRLSPVREILVS